MQQGFGRVGRVTVAIARAAGAGAALLVATALAVAAHAVWLDRWAAPPDPAAVIIVLGGGVLRDGTPGPDSRARTLHGVALYEAGLAPRIHFTGGHRNPEVIGLGASMARAARDAGVPAEAISSESGSGSTLQNALLSRAVLPPERRGPAILVSDGYHLARAWSTFRWAGYGPLELSAASALGPPPAGQQLRRIARETLAWWYNVPRALLWTTLDALGIDRERTLDLLSDGTRGGAAAG